ncbi:unnamed protein product [Camellia sinensis]
MELHLVHYPLQAIQSVPFSESKVQLLEAQKAELSNDKCTTDPFRNYSWCGQRKMPSHVKKLVFPEDFLTTLRTIAKQEDEIYQVSSLLQELVSSDGEKQPSDGEVRAVTWEACGDSGALQLLVDLPNMNEQQQGGVSDEAEPFMGSGRFDGRNLQLHFRSRLSLPLFTGGKVEGEQGAAIHIVLLDVNTGHVVTSGPESTIKLDVVVLEGDFNNEDDEGWTEEEFESHVVKEREGKRPLLTGDLQVTLKEGVGTLGELTFTDNSSWIRSRKFRLGLKVASGFCEGIRVGEAKTEAFTVKDHRGELYKKHYPPALNDDVWRLEKIGKDGSFHKRLNKSGIFTVEDFVRLVVRDSQKLRSLAVNKMWDALIEHAKTCAMSGKLYVYYADDTRNVGVVFNSIYELSGLITGEQYLLSDSLSDSQKLYVDTLVKKAYDNWNHVVIYDGI